MLPHDLPPWPVVYQQMRCWLAAGCFEAIIHGLLGLLRRATPPGRGADGGDPGQSHAAIDTHERRAGGL